MAKQQKEEPLIAKGKVSGDPAAEGLWSAVCVDVHDLGEVESTFKGQTRMVHKVLLGWEIDNLDPKTKMRQVAYRRFTLSVGTKSNLYRFINTWRGKPLTDKEMDGFNVKKLLGAPCQLQIVHFHKEDGSGVYANVDAALPLAKGMEKLVASGEYVRMKDRDTDQGPPTSKPVAATDPDDDLPF